MLIDTHCHLYDDKFSGDLEDVIRKSNEAGVMRMIIPASDLKTSLAAADIARRFEGVYAACGVHPHDAADASDGDYGEIERLLGNDRVVACGEIGLDYHYDFSPRGIQKEALARQADLAKRLGMPVILHSREAFRDLADILKSEGCSFGVVHCFSDTVLEARILLDMGFYIGFTGSVTFKNADDIREAASYVPLDRILFETDSPYLAPVPYRGKRNDPSLIPVIAERLADIKGISKEALADAVWHNARKLFSID